MKWDVFHEDWNGKSITTYNVLSDCFIPTLKQLKKESQDIYEFSERMKHEMMYHYWGKCEWELIISKDDDNKITLNSLFDHSQSLAVTNENGINWNDFYEYVLKRSYICKFDVYEQLKFRWEEFIDYCWYTRLPYERKNKKFGKIS